MSEQLVHQTISVFLNRALPQHAWHTALDSAGKASARIAANLKARGGKRGVPDHLILCDPFPVIFLEVKTDKGRLSPEQELVGECIERNGGHWFCVRSLEDTQYVLQQIGIPLRATLGEIRERIAEQNEGLRPKKRSTSRAHARKPSPSEVRRVAATGVWQR